MKKKHLLAALIAVVFIVFTCAVSVFAEETNTVTDDPNNSVVSQEPSTDPPDDPPAPPSDAGTSSVAPSSIPEPSDGQGTTGDEDPYSSEYSEEPSSEYYESSSDDYGNGYVDSSVYTSSASTGSLLPETSADGASGTTSHKKTSIPRIPPVPKTAPLFLKMIPIIRTIPALTTAAGSCGRESASYF